MIRTKPSVRQRPVLEKRACLPRDWPLVFGSVGGAAPAVPLTLRGGPGTRASSLVAVTVPPLVGEVNSFLQVASAISRPTSRADVG